MKLISIFLDQVLKFNLADSGLFCILPWLTMAVSANFGGWIADTLVSRGMSVTTVRKVSIIPLHLCTVKSSRKVAPFSQDRKISSVLFINVLSDNFLRKKKTYVPSLLVFDHGHLLATNLFSVCSIKQLWMFMFMLLFIFQPDHAVNWVPWSGFLLDSIKSCTFSCNGNIMHGVQSGIILPNDNILKFGQYESITQTSLFVSIARIFSA